MRPALVGLIKAACYPVRVETFVESDGALWKMTIERQCEEDFLWHPFIHKSLYIFKTQFFVVIRMTYKTATLGIQVFQL